MIGERSYSSQRALISGMDDLGDVTSDVRSSTPLPSFYRAVVKDVIYDPINLTQEEKDSLRETIVNTELIDRIPKNSIIATVITRGINKVDNTSQIFFACNSHDISPIKPGEHVFVFYADDYRSKQIGYWFCRAPEPLDTDDINFTHSDRKFEYSDGLSTAERSSGGTLPAPSFLNGDGLSEESYTLSNEKDYEDINKNSKANKIITKEPVARFTKRPADKLIQGSNGSRIVLGQDRTGSVTEPVVQGSPTIDIVTVTHEGLSENLEPILNNPRVIINSRNELEVDKNPKKKNKKDNSAEGDPNFETDQSRIYVSAKTNGDVNFNISADSPSSIGSYIVLNTSHNRIISREDVKITAGSTNVVIKNDGKIIINGSNIELGNTPTKQPVARKDDLVMPAADMQTFMIQVSIMLNAITALLNVPGPIIGVPGGPFSPSLVPQVPSGFGIIQNGSQIVKSS